MTEAAKGIKDFLSHSSRYSFSSQGSQVAGGLKQLVTSDQEQRPHVPLLLLQTGTQIQGVAPFRIRRSPTDLSAGLPDPDRSSPRLR